jgi:hypothetical protein
VDIATDAAAAVEKHYLAELDTIRSAHAAEAQLADGWAAPPSAGAYTLPPTMVAEHLEREALAALEEAAGTGLPCFPVR